MQSSKISYKLLKISRNMINYKEKIIYTHTIIIQVKYECSCVSIVMTSRQKFLNGIKGIFNKVVSEQSLKGMYVVTIFEYILW